MRKSVALCLLALVASACAGESATTTSDAGSGDTTAATSDTAATLNAGDTTTSEGNTTTTSDRDLAPDFTLELGNGDTYTLSDGARPVYLVFWAEW
jgi:hypothetical protein